MGGMKDGELIGFVVIWSSFRLHFVSLPNRLCAI